MFSSKEQVSFNFMAEVTVWSDFGAQENKICHCFHFLPIYLPWSDGTGCMILVFWILSFKPAFFSLLFHPHQEALYQSLLAGTLQFPDVMREYIKNRKCHAAAKSCQSCPTLCDPIASSPTGSSVPGVLQARILELPFPSPMQESEICSHRQGKSGSSDRLYFLGLQNHCAWWLQPQN